jgi:hypothetical protein
MADSSETSPSSQASKWVLGLCLSIAAIWLAWRVGKSVFQQDNDPFSYRRAYGKVQYEDGSLVPIAIRLSFIPAAEREAGFPSPPSGSALVDPASGRFAHVTSRTVGDGIVAGDHTVVISVIPPAALDPAVIPSEYCRVETSPLKVTAGSRLPFLLSLRKPSATRGSDAGLHPAKLP